jgi:hypothetical protein
LLLLLLLLLQDGTGTIDVAVVAVVARRINGVYAEAGKVKKKTKQQFQFSRAQGYRQTIQKSPKSPKSQKSQRTQGGP